jgi:predicted Zn-dependent peptidase
MQFHRSVLPNGLRVIIVPMPALESATVLVMVGAGSRYETRNISGISHFFEHMAFKGTQKRPSAIDIASLIDGIGGEFNAFTGKEYTGYYIKAGKGHVDLMLDVLSDMLQHSKLDPQELDKERGVIIEEMNLYEDTPMRNIGDVYENLLYDDTPLGWDTIGFKDVILSVKREDFLRYMGSLYSPHNMVVVIAGGVKSGNQGIEANVTLVEKYFGMMKRFAIRQPQKIEETQKKPAYRIKQKDTEQVHIALGVRTTKLNSKDRHPLSILAAIMGGGMSSRLFAEVREKRGLAYYVRSVSDHYTDCGSLVSTAGIDPKRIKEAISVMMQEYRKVATKISLTKDELRKAKELSKGHLVLELEDSRAVAGFFAHQELLEDRIRTPEEVLKEIDSIAGEQVEEVGKRYFTDERLNLALIGNFPDGEMLEELLHF